MSQLVEWITGLFDDCRARAPFGVALELDRAEPPLVALVTPADMPTSYVSLDRDDIRGRIDFACRLQAVLDGAVDQPVPRCPNHDLCLTPTHVGEEVAWTCPERDFRCEVGAYELSAFWPPTKADHWAAPLLAKRFHQHGVRGLASFSVDDRDGRLVARVAARPEADQEAMRAAASPLLVEFSGSPAISTVRERRLATGPEPAQEILTLTGAAMHLARLDGVLRRAEPQDECDFLVGNTRVRLAAAHITDGYGSPLLMDGDGIPFADEGDQVSCGGGFGPHGPVREGASAFKASRISVYRRESAPRPRAAAAAPLDTKQQLALTNT
ncbi:MAG: hypothetical protein ACP5H2_05705 [Solirubrobacteraceae bacterium]